MHRFRLLVPVLFAVAACRGDDTLAPASPSAAKLSPSFAASVGTVYTESNSASGNAILVFDRAPNGALTPAGSYATGGLGTGSLQGSQGGVTFTSDGRFLLAVNAGSNSVSSFRVNGDGSLDLVGAVPSGGTLPISVTSERGLAYVLNAGGAGGIAGFTIGSDGALTPIAGSARPLSTAAPAPAQIGFDPSGKVLVVTEKGTKRITTYTVGNDGLASAPQIQTSAGVTPFGFAFTTSGLLIVSEAFGGAADGSAASSYTLDNAGVTRVVSPSVPTTETAACWFTITNNGKFAYTTNNGSGSITGYAINQGALERLDADGRTADTGAGSAPIDLAVSRNSQFLYVLNAGTETIGAFSVNVDGSLTPVDGGASGLPAGTFGLAVR